MAIICYDFKELTCFLFVENSDINSNRVFICGTCRVHLSAYEDIVSKSFQGRTGRAYLFEKVSNITLGPLEDRILNTGMHKVSDIYCNCCQGYLGWKYEEASDESQRYKVGKCVIERAKMSKETGWI